MFVLHIRPFPQSAESQQIFEIIGGHVSKWARQMSQPSGGSCTSYTCVLSTHCLKNSTGLSKEQQLVWGYQRTQTRKFYLLDHIIYQASEAESCFHGYLWVFPQWLLVWFTEAFLFPQCTHCAGGNRNDTSEWVIGVEESKTYKGTSPRQTPQAKPLTRTLLERGRQRPAKGSTIFMSS